MAFWRERNFLDCNNFLKKISIYISFVLIFGCCFILMGNFSFLPFAGQPKKKVNFHIKRFRQRHNEVDLTHFTRLFQLLLWTVMHFMCDRIGCIRKRLKHRFPVNLDNIWTNYARHLPKIVRPNTHFAWQDNNKRTDSKYFDIKMTYRKRLHIPENCTPIKEITADHTDKEFRA